MQGLEEQGKNERLLDVFFGTPNGSTISVSEQGKIEIKLIEETAEK